MGARQGKTARRPTAGEMTREDARAYLARWRLVNAREWEELRAATPEAKLRQLATLMNCVDALGWREALAEGENEVRARWMRLRKAYGV